MNDRTPMPFGKHVGKPLEDVPASYLLWLADEVKKSGARDQVRRDICSYVNANREALEQEAAAERPGDDE